MQFKLDSRPIYFQYAPCDVMHTMNRQRIDVKCVCEMHLDQEQLAKPFRKIFRGVRGGNGLVLSLFL